MIYFLIYYITNNHKLKINRVNYLLKIRGNLIAALVRDTALVYAAAAMGRTALTATLVLVLVLTTYSLVLVLVLVLVQLGHFILYT